MNQHMSSSSEEITVQSSEPIFNSESNYKGRVKEYLPDTSEQLQKDGDLYQSQGTLIQPEVDVDFSPFDIGQAPSTCCSSSECSSQNVYQLSDAEIHADQEALMHSLATEERLEIVENSVSNREEESSNSPLSTVDGESLSKSYFTCLGKLRYCFEKITNLVNNAANTSVIHYESVFTEVRDICRETATLVHQTQSLANLKIRELSNISSELYISEQDVPIEHDPAKRPEKLSEGQIKYLIHIGPCQPKLSCYPNNTHTWSTVSQMTKPTAMFVKCL